MQSALTLPPIATPLAEYAKHHNLDAGFSIRTEGPAVVAWVGKTNASGSTLEDTLIALANKINEESNAHRS